MATVHREARYLAAVVQNSGVMSPNSNTYALPRFPMSNVFTNTKRFKEKLTAGAFKNADESFNTNGKLGRETPMWKVSIWANSVLNARRKLFTLTAKDNSGLWHWHSRIYFQPQLHDE